MKKETLHDLVLETVNEYITEAEISSGDNDFKIRVDVNRNPTKEGIRIKLMPSIKTDLGSEEKTKVQVQIQKALNKALGQYNIQVDIDKDTAQGTDDPDELRYLIPIKQIKMFIVDALTGKKGQED